MTSKGFDPNNKPQTQPPQPTGAASLEDEIAAECVAEISQLRNQVNGALNGTAQGIQTILDEYNRAAQPMVEQASLELYGALSGRRAFRAIGVNVGELMAQHPTGPKHSITVHPLKPVSFKPLNPVIRGNYLTAMDAPNSTASHG